MFINKRFPLWITLLILSIMLIPSSNLEAAVATEGDYEYEAYGGGIASIIGYIGTDKEITIPDTIGENNSKVTSISYDAFRGKGLTSVTIPDSVTIIGEWAFSNNELVSVTLPKNLITISRDAFSNNKLNNITIPNSVKEIGSNAFRNNQLTSISLPDSVTTIGSAAFGENNLTNIILPNNITKIENNVFIDNNLISVTIPDFVIEIGQFAFQNNQLTSVTFPDSMTSIGQSAFANNELTNVQIPEGITKIDNSAFSKNYLTSITIPESVTSVGNNAFSDNKLTSVTFPNELRKIGRHAFSYNELADVTFPDMLTSIGDYAFFNNELTSLILPDNVTRINEGAFYSNYLTSVVFGTGNTEIGKDTFRDNKLTRITLPDSITSVNSGAFWSNELSSVVIRNKDTVFDSDVFLYNTMNLKLIGYDPSTAKDYAYQYSYPFQNGEEEVSFSPDGNTAWETTHTTDVQVSGYDETIPLQYSWSIERDTPSDIWSDMDVTNQTITTPQKSGQYYLHVRGTNLLGDIFNHSSKRFYLDNTAPTIQLSNDGNTTGQREVSTKVTVDDAHSGVDENNLYYIWTDGDVAPQFDSDWEQFTNEDEIIFKNKRGTWYLHVYAKDLVGNETIQSSKAFQLSAPPSGGGGTLPNPSNDTTLTKVEINIDKGSLIEFDPAQTEYFAETESGTFELDVETSASGATLTVNGEVVEGKETFSLEEGENVFEIVITAEDGTTEEYTLIIHRLKEVPFPDIKEHWANDFIKTSYRNGWFKGYPDGSFGPDRQVTRMQAASLFVRILGLTDHTEVPFTDIREIEDETIAELEKAFANGVVNGYSDGTFKPYADVNRAQLALMIYRTYEKITGELYKPSQSADFPDISGYDEETQQAIAMLVELGIAEGSNGKFLPNNKATRAHAAKMLVNFKKILDE